MPKKGNIPWNKGKKETRPEVIKKLSKSHIGIQARSKNPTWKGGRIISRGYILIHKPNHPFVTKNNNCVLEHRLIVESQIGRYLKPEESVHHRNYIKSNNEKTNLICFTSESAHQRFHSDPTNVKPEEIVFDGRTLRD